MFTAEEARKAVEAHEARELEAASIFALALIKKIEQSIKQNATNGLNSLTYCIEKPMFRQRNIEEICTNSLIEAGYKVEVSNQAFHIHW